jgi:putative flippase GtrA
MSSWRAYNPSEVVRAVAPPLYSTFSAVTELFVTAAVFWFFYRALGHGDYRFGLITAAIVYETLFNISYMVRRLFTHQEGVTHTHEPWVTWFVAVHGTLSLAMFIGLVWLVVWAWRRTRAGDLHPLAGRRGLAYTFIGLWTASILSGEAIYLFYWTGVIS